MNLTQLQRPPKDRVRALFGLEPAALGQLLAAVLPPLMERRHAQQQAKKGRKRAVGGGRRRKLLPYQEVLITLVYLRHNVSHAVVGQMFSVSADISENSFHEVILRSSCCCATPALPTAGMRRRSGPSEKKWTKREEVDQARRSGPRRSRPGTRRRWT